MLDNRGSKLASLKTASEDDKEGKKQELLEFN